MRITYLFIKCTFRNTLITITNFKKQTLYQLSSKAYNLKVKRKNNPYVLYRITQDIIYFLKKIKNKKLIIYIQGIGAGRYNIIKHLIKDFKLILLEDRTKIPFNGCRPKKKKRK